MKRAGDLAVNLLDVVEHHLTALAAGPLPDFALPRLLMACDVGPDVRADLLFTLGLMHGCGRTEIAGIEVTDAIAQLLAGVAGKRTNTFYSYRVAETVARFGAFTDNPVLETLDARQRSEVAAATDSTDWLELLDAGVLPRNYAAVLARCELARRSLDLLDDECVLDDLVARVTALLGGHLDDSNAGIGRYDVYSVDIHLFCEPLATRLGPPWRDGARLALDLVDRVAGRDGAAVAWGRSTGVLALCHLIELAGLVARHDLTDEPGRFYARAAAAAPRLEEWFVGGWTTAHQHRSSDPYRGLDRRLQMTLDCLGKLADTARGLQLVADTPLDVEVGSLFPDRDEMVWFDRDRHAGVWSFRSALTAFTLPLVGGSTTDYLPTPRLPGLFEVPVGSSLVTGTPVVVHRGVRYATGGLPTSASHAPGRLQATYDGFEPAGHLEPEEGAVAFAGQRSVTWRVDGRTISGEEELTFAPDGLPHAVGLQFTETRDRPLIVSFESTDPYLVATVDVDGVAEYRSCWGELTRLHQVDLEPAPSLSLRWSVTPVLRIVSTAVGHPYHDSLYGPLAGRVQVKRLTYAASTDPVALARLAARTDQLHLHWPEWLLAGGVEPHHRLIAGLREGGVRIVWTQHNLVAHSKDPEMVAVYQAWADAADLVIHHSHWGRDRALATYRYGTHTRHVVVPHGLFGEETEVTGGPNVRGEVEAELGLSSDVIRLGIVGAPRVEKDVAMAMRAVARCGRDDIELLVLSLDGEDVPDDPRIVAQPYEMVPRAEYDRRLSALDALLMPFDPDGEMLTTGTIGDAFGRGLPTVASDWPFLTETLGEAAITYGSTEDDLVRCLSTLDRADLARAADAARAGRPRHEWVSIAELFFTELDRLGSTQH